jgi:hypothetical protein
VDDLEGSFVARERLRWILRAMNGEVTVAEACAELGIGESRFHQLRGEMLQAAVERLEPRAAGRPAKSVDPAERRINALEERVVEVTRELDLAQIRLELTGTVPVSVKKIRPRDALPAASRSNPPQNPSSDPPPSPANDPPETPPC